MRFSAIIVIVMLGCVYANTCGGNCPSNDCVDCPCGNTVHKVNANKYCQVYSKWSQTCCMCITSHESGDNSNAVNHNTGGSDDVGLFQINDVNWPSCSAGAAPCNPDVNTSCAKKVFGWGGNTWKNWSTCHVCNCCSKAQDDAYKV